MPVFYILKQFSYFRVKNNKHFTCQLNKQRNFGRDFMFTQASPTNAAFVFTIYDIFKSEENFTLCEFLVTEIPFYPSEFPEKQIWQTPCPTIWPLKAHKYNSLLLQLTTFIRGSRFIEYALAKHRQNFVLHQNNTLGIYK